MMRAIAFWASAFRSGAKMNPIPPPDMPPSIQNPQKSPSNSSSARAISVSVNRLVAQGMMLWIGPRKVTGGGPAKGLDIPFLQGVHQFIQEGECLLPTCPLHRRAQEILLCHHLENGSHVLRHPAMHKHQRVLERLPRRLRDLILPEDMMDRQQAPTRNIELRIVFLRRHSRNQLDPGPYPAAVLPAPARSTKPLPENGPRKDETPFVLLEGPR